MEKNEFHKFVMNNIAQTGLSAEDRDNIAISLPNFHTTRITV